MNIATDSDWLLHGIDFTSAPTRRKTITIASGYLRAGIWHIHTLQALPDYVSFGKWLQLPGPWLGAFDFPFSLPRELVEHLHWPITWPALMTHFASLSRAEIRNTFKAFCDARPVGGKFAHRGTDIPAGSSSSMKWVNPPVAYMLHAGVPLLRAAGVSLPGLNDGDPQRVALEGYPGMLARSITRSSYKNDDRMKQTPERHEARAMIIDHLERGEHRFGIRLDAGQHRAALLEDASGDLLDAALCGILAAWAWQRRECQFGLPDFDPLEGWIVGA
ncbi:MAG: hypothetical protein ACI9ZF_001689 [Bradyrhizobium sp.]|jgi:hypothetical protein